MKDRLIQLFGEEWYSKLELFLTSNDFLKINSFIANERKSGKLIYPEAGSDDNFRCYRLTQPNQIKVVIIGNQYIYDGSYDGLCYSGSKLIEESPILKTLFNQVTIEYPENDTNLLSGLDLMDLSRWAKQGVFLLNKELTYVKNRPLDHLPLWNKFIIETIKVINEYPYICWLMIGEDNWSFEQHINLMHRKIKIKDPIRFPNEFNQARVFSSINEHLNAVNKKEIIW